MIKMRTKSIVYSIMMKIRRKSIVYGIRMKIRLKYIIYSIMMIIIYMKKCLHSYWLREGQFSVNIVQKRGNSVQKSGNAVQKEVSNQAF